VGRLRHEAGQTVVLFAILLPLFLGLGAIAVDIGYWYVVRKSAQDAADAAALAAARELPVGSIAEATAIEYVEANMPDASPTVEFPYVPDASSGTGGGEPDHTKIEVTVEHATDTFFGGLFGVLSPTVTRRAVAERLDGSRKLAIYSHSYDGCSAGLEIDARGVWIDGLVHSNGQYDVHSGSGPDALWAADGTIWRENCVSNLDPDFVGATYGEGPDFLPRDVFELTNWPAWFRAADFGWPTCGGSDFSGEHIEVLATAVRITNPDRVIPHTGIIPSGTYCATESFTIRGDGLKGTVSVLAPRISVEANHLKLDPFTHGVLFFTVPNTSAIAEDDGSLGSGGNPTCVPSNGNDLQLDGSRHVWSGIVFNPCGRVVLGTDDSDLTSAIIGRQVRVTADEVRLTGTGALAASVGLVE
jgi:hypothetical protein